jgi:cell division protein FtsL
VLAVSVYRAKLGAEETETKIEALAAEARKVTEEISVLKAEEAYLTRPERIGPIAHDKLNMQPAQPEQFTAPEALSRRLGEEQVRLPDAEAPADDKAKLGGKPPQGRPKG